MENSFELEFLKDLKKRCFELHIAIAGYETLVKQDIDKVDQERIKFVESATDEDLSALNNMLAEVKEEARKYKTNFHHFKYDKRVLNSIKNKYRTKVNLLDKIQAKQSELRQKYNHDSSLRYENAFVDVCKEFLTREQYLEIADKVKEKIQNNQ